MKPILKRVRLWFLARCFMMGFLNGLIFVDREILGFASKAAGFAALRIPLQSPLLHLRFG